MIASIVFVFFCVPECKGKTLEQVDFLFNQGVSLRAFGKTDAEAMMSAAYGPSTNKQRDSEDKQAAVIERQQAV
jgi:SP family sugar:H+ symporter-like MFS transporter